MRVTTADVAEEGPCSPNAHPGYLCPSQGTRPAAASQLPPLWGVGAESEAPELSDRLARWLTAGTAYERWRLVRQAFGVARDSLFTAPFCLLGASWKARHDTTVRARRWGKGAVERWEAGCGHMGGAAAACSGLLHHPDPVFRGEQKVSVWWFPHGTCVGSLQRASALRCAAVWRALKCSEENVNCWRLIMRKTSAELGSVLPLWRRC